MSEYNKLQIRAKALAVISELQYMQPAEKCVVRNLINELKDISDKKTLTDILINEMIKYEEPFSLLIASVISEVSDNDTIIEAVKGILTSTKVSDVDKYKSIQLLRGISSELSYENIIEYFDNPTEILNTDTARMLKKALSNPEAQIDFMDFLSAISNKDKELLLNSFSDDFDGDSVANILTPIVYSDMPDEIISSAIGLLGDSKSSLALKPLNYVIEHYDNEAFVKMAKAGLTKLKFAGASEEKVEEFFKKQLSSSIPDKCYATIPDGNGNQGILFTRLKRNKSFELATFIVNNKKGIVDSFGFYSVSENEIFRIVKRFFRNSDYILVSPSYVKSMINRSVETTIKNNCTFPYEFICWENRIFDVEPLKQSVEDFVQENINPTVWNSVSDALNVLTSSELKTWFFTSADNQKFNSLCNKCFTNEDVTLEIIEKEMDNYFPEIWSQEEQALWKDRIIVTSYLLFNNMKEKEAENLYSLIFNEDVFKNIMYSILRKSIHYHIYNLIQIEKELSETTNIFRKNQKSENKYISAEKLSLLADEINKKWLTNG